MSAWATAHADILFCRNLWLFHQRRRQYLPGFYNTLAYNGSMLTITVSPDCIRVQASGTNFDEELPNSVAYDLETRQPLVFGATPETLAREDPQAWETHWQATTGFSALFTPETPPYQLETMFLDYYQFLATDRKRPGWLDVLLNHWQDFSFRIEGYEAWPAERRQRFAFDLQTQRARRLSVNGRELAIPFWKRRLAFWSEIGFTYLFPIGGFAWIFSQTSLFDRPALYYPALVLTPLLAAILGMAAWMLLARRLVPAAYLRYTARPGSFMRAVWDWLAARLLPEEDHEKQV